jgi:hypothetical protein
LRRLIVDRSVLMFQNGDGDGVVKIFFARTGHVSVAKKSDFECDGHVDQALVLQKPQVPSAKLKLFVART